MRFALLALVVLAAPRVEIEWSEDLPAAVEQARKSGKPLFIVFR